MTKSWPAVITKGLTYFQRKRTLAAALYQSQNTVHFYQSVMSLAFWSGKLNFHSVWGPQRELYSVFYSLSYAKKKTNHVLSNLAVIVHSFSMSIFWSILDAWPSTVLREHLNFLLSSELPYPFWQNYFHLQVLYLGWKLVTEKSP